MGSISGLESAHASLQDRDYTIIIAKTVAEPQNPPPGFEARWQSAQEMILQLAKQCEVLDPDGITMYAVTDQPDQASSFQKYTHVTSSNLHALVEANSPPCRLHLKPA